MTSVVESGKASVAKLQVNCPEGRDKSGSYCRRAGGCLHCRDLDAKLFTAIHGQPNFKIQHFALCTTCYIYIYIYIYMHVRKYS